MGSCLKFLIISNIGFSLGVAATSAGTTSTTLDGAMMTENVDLGVINFDSGDVSLVEQVRALQSDGTFTFVPNAAITVNGMSASLIGGGTTRGFFIGGSGADGTGSVTINDLTFDSCVATGGNGNGIGSGTIGCGGGGFGAGGGLFVGEGTNVILNDCAFTSCGVVGGSGAPGTSNATSAGGGMRGTPPRVGTSGNPSGGGGFGGDGLFGNGGGASGFSAGNATAGTPGLNFDGGGTAGSPGVGGNTGSASRNGGYGGGGGAGFGGGAGTGGFGGGGGTNSFQSVAGDGGFGGGGGGRVDFEPGTGGNGGFGAGGGSVGSGGTAGIGGFGGGDGVVDGASGSGAAFGGAIFIQNGGALTINISSSFTGPLFSGNTATAAPMGNASTDPLAGFGVLGQDMFIMSTGQVTFDVEADVSVPSGIGGNQGDASPDVSADTTIGGLTKRGSAMLELTLENTYTGITTVEAGNLRINDPTNDYTINSILTETIVEPGATLSGNFTIKNISSNPMSGNLTNSGTVCPGVNGLGRIQLEGNYEQTSSGSLVIDITPNGEINDKVFVTAPMTNTAMLAGTMEVIIPSGNYIEGTTYTVINAPTMGTTFDTIIKSGSNADNVEIDVLYSSVVITILGNRISEDQIIDSGVPQQVNACILAAIPITPESDFAMMVEKLGQLSNSEVNRTLTTLSAVRFGALEWINARNNSFIADLLSRHLNELCCSPRDSTTCDCNANVWINIFTNSMDNKGRLDNLRRYNADATGVMVGMDYSFNPCFYLGGSLGYTRTHLLWRNYGGTGDIDSYYGAVYGSYQCSFLTGDISVIGGGSKNELKRQINFSNVFRTAKSDPWSQFVTAHLGIRGDWDFCCLNWEPFVLTDYHYFHRDHFSEKGASSLNLSVQSKNQQIMRGEAGLRLSYEVNCECYCYSPFIGLSWVGEFPLNKSKQPASFKGQSCVIDAESYDSNIQLASPQAGIKITNCNGFSLSLGYKGLYNDKTRINELEGRLDWVF